MVEFKIHAIVFFDTNTLKPVCKHIYTSRFSWTERKIITEFVEFGSIELLDKLEIQNDCVVKLSESDTFSIYITKETAFYVSMGCALLVVESNDSQSSYTFTIMKQMIRNYISDNKIPTDHELLQYFKTKKILNELDDTKAVLKRTISKVLTRGEKIEELIEKTELLSDSSKTFLLKSKELNTCCWVFPKKYFSWF